MKDLKEFEQLTEELNKMEIHLPQTTCTVNAADFGVRAETDQDNTRAFGEALAYCRKVGAAKLVVPKGIYYFKSCEGDAHLSLDDMGFYPGRKWK